MWGHLDVAILVDEDVPRLEVAVQDVPRVHRAHARQYLRCVRWCVISVIGKSPRALQMGWEARTGTAAWLGPIALH